MGDTELAENVRIYDKVGSGSLVEVKLADVPVKKNSGANVLYAEKNYTGKISLLILDNATGDAYVYGRYTAFWHIGIMTKTSFLEIRHFPLFLL